METFTFAWRKHGTYTCIAWLLNTVYVFPVSAFHACPVKNGWKPSCTDILCWVFSEVLILLVIFFCFVKSHPSTVPFTGMLWKILFCHFFQLSCQLDEIEALNDQITSEYSELDEDEMVLSDAKKGMVSSEPWLQKDMTSLVSLTSHQWYLLSAVYMLVGPPAKLLPVAIE